MGGGDNAADVLSANEVEPAKRASSHCVHIQGVPVAREPDIVAKVCNSIVSVSLPYVNEDCRSDRQEMRFARRRVIKPLGTVEVVPPPHQD